MSLLDQYVAVALLHVTERRAEEELGGSIPRLRGELAKRVGSNLEDDDVKRAIQLLVPFAAAEEEVSPLTGGFWLINYDNFRYYFVEDKPSEGDTEQEYREIRNEALSHPILMAYARRGIAYAEDAIEHLLQANSVRWDELRSEGNAPANAVPASDRIVTLDHNQQTVLETASTELIDAVERENSLDGDSGLRQRVLGQIKAGRELIRAQTLSAYLLYQTLVAALGGLIERYKGHAIGIAAAKLLELLIEHIFKQG